MTPIFLRKRKGNAAHLGPRILPSSGINYPFWLFIFLFIQFFSSGLLFFAGAQEIRQYIKVAPYLSSPAMLLVYWAIKKNQTPPGTGFILGALILLFLGLFHPSTILESGWAQCIFQLCMVAPLFWGGKAIIQKEGLKYLLWFIFIGNGASALVGVLQVYYPGTFMPPEFNAFAMALNPEFVTSLSYRGADGQMIIRPPGLSDIPGGAAVAGAFVAAMGITLGTRKNQAAWLRLACFGMAAMGMFSLYLTQVRSLFLMVLAAVLAMCYLLFRRGALFQGAFIASITLGLLVATFLWAVVLGGSAVSNRYLGLAEEGILESYQRNRGSFVSKTFTDIIWSYPFGAGVGRWGIMNLYFGRFNSQGIQPIHAEIQMTGWLLDGGIFMLVLYMGAIIANLFFVYRLITTVRDQELAYWAALVFSMNLLVLGQSMAGPTFNSKLAIQFWLVAAALHGALRGERARWNSLAATRTQAQTSTQPDHALMVIS